jgi:tRNA(fMet)-specific endonuclease VapC
MFIADTDALIDFLSGAGEADRIRTELETGRLHTTAIAAFELLAGARGRRQVDAVDNLLAALSILPVDDSAAGRAAVIRRGLSAEGVGIGMADALISGIGLNRNAILLSRNRRHFQRVARLNTWLRLRTAYKTGRYNLPSLFGKR